MVTGKGAEGELCFGSMWTQPWQGSPGQDRATALEIPWIATAAPSPAPHPHGYRG